MQKYNVVRFLLLPPLVEMYVPPRCYVWLQLHKVINGTLCSIDRHNSGYSPRITCSKKFPEATYVSFYLESGSTEVHNPVKVTRKSAEIETIQINQIPYSDETDKVFYLNDLKFINAPSVDWLGRNKLQTQVAFRGINARNQEQDFQKGEIGRAHV